MLPACSLHLPHRHCMPAIEPQGPNESHRRAVSSHPTVTACRQLNLKDRMSLTGVQSPCVAQTHPQRLHGHLHQLSHIKRAPFRTPLPSIADGHAMTFWEIQSGCATSTGAASDTHKPHVRASERAPESLHTVTACRQLNLKDRMSLTGVQSPISIPHHECDEWGLTLVECHTRNP
jgi:hypothetical protein